MNGLSPSCPETIDAQSVVEKLLIGPWAVGEFQRLRELIGPALRLTCLASSAETIGLLADSDLVPELLLLAQPRPGYYSQREIDQLQQAAPLARIVMTAGSWCEGELRTGRPVSGVIRLYWYELLGWLAAGEAQRAIGKRPAWSEPLDGVRAGHTIDDGTAPRAPADARLIVDATDFSVFAALEAALSPLGWQCQWQPRHRPKLHAPLSSEAPHAAIWDGGQLNESELADLTAFTSRVKPTPVVALLDFPRAEHYQRVHNVGAAAIVAKPYQAALLARTLNNLLSQDVGRRVAPSRQEGV